MFLLFESILRQQSTKKEAHFISFFVLYSHLSTSHLSSLTFIHLKPQADMTKCQQTGKLQCMLIMMAVNYARVLFHTVNYNIGLKNIICYTARVSLTWWFIICGFHCTVHKSCAEVTPLCVVQLYK